MTYHPYHFLLIRLLIRQKVNGDHRLPLVHADLVKLATDKELKIAPGYIHKVLGEKGKGRDTLNSNTLNELAMFVGFNSWRDFTCKNPVPDRYFFELQKPETALLLDKLVANRIKEINSPQLRIDFPC